MKNKYIYIACFVAFFGLLNVVGNKVLLIGIERFYGLKQYSEILLIGHSQLMLSVDKDALENALGEKVSKYTREGVNVYDRYFMVKQYLDTKYSDSLKLILYGVDLHLFVKEGLSKDAYTLFYPFMGDSIMNAYIKENAHTQRDYLIHRFFPLTRYSDALLNASFRGWRDDFSNYKIGKINIEEYKKSITFDEQKYNRPVEMDTTLIRFFEETMNMITQRGIQVILLNMPVVDVLIQANNENSETVFAYFQKMADANERIEYWDLNSKYSTLYDLFYDPIHVNPEGQQEITDELIQRLKINL